MVFHDLARVVAWDMKILFPKVICHKFQDEWVNLDSRRFVIVSEFNDMADRIFHACTLWILQANAAHDLISEVRAPPKL